MAINSASIALANENVAVDYATITSGATATPSPFRALWLGTAGSVTIISPYGSTATFVAPQGVLPVAGVSIVTATVSGIVALY